jgi:hypothetical protein
VTKNVCHYDYDLRRIVREPGPPPQVTVNGVHVGFTVRWQYASGSVTVTVNTSVFDAATAETLLAVDPPASGGPNMALPTSRYTLVRQIDLDPTTTDNPDTDQHTESQWSTLGTTTATNQVRTDTLKAGLLAFLGVGPEQGQTTVFSLSASNSRVDGTGTTVTTEATLRTR